MEILGTISFIVIISITGFSIGVIAMARYKNSSAKPVIKKTPTRDTIYADHVISTAAKIYCDYNESRIIRPGAQVQQKKDRYGEALQESLNLVGAAYRYFDLTDSQDKTEPKKPVFKKIDLRDTKIN